MTVRAKFRVSEVTKTSTEHNEQHAVRLVPVVSGSPENERFYQFTPGGQIDLQIVNADTAAMLVPGKEYYVDFIPAE